MKFRKIAACIGAVAVMGMSSLLSFASDGDDSQTDGKQGGGRGGYVGGIAKGALGKIFRTTRGREYYDCEVIARDPHGVTFRHRDGVAKLAYSDLPRAEQRANDYDPEKARQFVRRHYPVRPVRLMAAPSNAVREGALAAYPTRRGGRGRGWALGLGEGGSEFYNPYSLSGAVTNIATFGSVFGGFIQPYFAGSFGTPRLVTPVPGGFFTPTTLRVGGRPIVDSPIAPGMASFSQVRDARAAAVRASVRATPGRAVPASHHGGGGGHK